MEPKNDPKVSPAAKEKAAEGEAKGKHPTYPEKTEPKTKAAKAEADARKVARLWKGGEKLQAIRLADEIGMKPEDQPEGMAGHRLGMR